MKRATAWILGLVSIGFALHVSVFDFITDDAYISFRYAENWVRHGALEFNLGERVEGATNFLWTALLAGLLNLGCPLEISARLFGALFGIAGLFLTWHIARRKNGVSALIAPALLASIPAYACWSSGGLETQMFGFLALLGLWLTLAEKPVWSGVAYAAAAMTRPEGVLFWAIAALVETIRSRRIPWRLGMSFGLLFGAFETFRVVYYGDFFPNTFYVKAQGRAFARGGHYLWSFVTDNRLWVAAPLLFCFRARDRQLWQHALPLVAIVLLYVASVGGDFMALHRFLVPLLPFLALFVADAFRVRPGMLWAAPLLIGGAIANAVQVDRHTLAYIGQKRGIDSIGYLRLFAKDRLRVGNYLRNHFPADTLVAVGGAGALPFASRLPTLDSFGLTDKTVARQKSTSDRPGHQKIATIGYLLQRKVDLACFPTHPNLAEQGYRRTCFPVEVDRRTIPGGRYCCWVSSRLQRQ